MYMHYVCIVCIALWYRRICSRLCLVPFCTSFWFYIIFVDVERSVVESVYLGLKDTYSKVPFEAKPQLTEISLSY